MALLTRKRTAAATAVWVSLMGIMYIQLGAWRRRFSGRTRFMAPANSCSLASTWRRTSRKELGSKRGAMREPAVYRRMRLSQTLCQQ
jgi:hypothetical protein